MGRWGRTAVGRPTGGAACGGGGPRGLTVGGADGRGVLSILCATLRAMSMYCFLSCARGTTSYI